MWKRYCLFAIFCASQIASGSTPTVHISEQLIREKAGCVDYLRASVENALISMRATETTAYLGEYDELGGLLLKAGVDGKTVKSTVDAVTKIHNTAFNFPALQATATVLDDLVAARKLLVCTIATKCPLARAGQNFTFFTNQHEGILLMPPPPVGGAQPFALDLFASVGWNAADRILLTWLQAGFEQHKKDAGSVDKLYREFAMQYDGTFHPNSSSIDQGFTLTFMALFQMVVSDNVSAIHNPSDVIKNRMLLAKGVYPELTVGRNSAITAKTMQKLGIREENLFTKAIEIINIVGDTINNGQPEQ